MPFEHLPVHGIHAGAIPFVDSNGNLAQNSAQLLWNNSNRQLSVGNNLGTATLYVYDSLPTHRLDGTDRARRTGTDYQPAPAVADLERNRAGPGGSFGRFSGASFGAATSATRAAWQDSGNSTDPSGAANGDLWFNTSQNVHKTVEPARPIHSLRCSAAVPERTPARPG